MPICSAWLSTACPSQGLLGIEHTPTSRPSLAAATDVFTPYGVLTLHLHDALNFGCMKRAHSCARSGSNSGEPESLGARDRAGEAYLPPRGDQPEYGYRVSLR